MNKRWWILGVVTVAAVIGLYLFQPWRLLTRSSIDEALPTVTATSEAQQPAVLSPTTSEPEMSAASTPSATSTPETLTAGAFVDAEHATSGTARIIRLADGSRYLRLENLSSSDGPDLHVWLTDQPSGGAWGSYDDGRYVTLGVLKATDGNQNYAIPAEVDLDGLVSAVIWCDRFDVAFGSAALGTA